MKTSGEGGGGASALTFLVVENAEGLQQFVLGALHHAQPRLALVLKRPVQQDHATAKGKTESLNKLRQSVNEIVEKMKTSCILKVGVSNFAINNYRQILSLNLTGQDRVILSPFKLMMSRAEDESDLRVKGMASKRRSTSLRKTREVFIFRPYCLLGSLL